MNWLFIIALPVACIAWTITHEEIFREIREYFADRSKRATNIFSRKFFYIFTCEYCFSHYVTILALWATDYRLLIDDWRGYIIAGFSIVWIANFYMTVFALLRQSLKREKNEAAIAADVVKELHQATPPEEEPAERW